MNCTECKSTNVILNETKNYGKCNDCGNLMMDLAGTWQTFPIEESMRQMMEVSLGFQTIDMTPKKPKIEDAPKTCFACNQALEVIENEDVICCRCTACGILTQWNGFGLTPIQVEAPGGGFNAEFQALFEKNLGFSYKVRKKPLGIVEK